MSIFQLYLLTRAAPIQALFLIIAVISGISLLAVLIGWGMERGVKWTEEEKVQLDVLMKGVAKKMTFVFCLSSSVAVLTPTPKELAMILGGYYISNSEEVKKLPSNVVKTMNDFLEKYQDKTEKE